MKSTTTPLKRDTGKLIAKNLIILVVLLTVCSLSIWAWFASETEAEANGISIKAKASGVQVSWDGENYYNDLTALSNTDESFTSGKSGLAKFITGAKDTPYGLKLITGNGVDFFEPYLNRRTGEAVKNNGVWQGVTINESNSQGRFVDVDLYFRGTSKGNVWLHQDSTARPLSTNAVDRTSDYGGFTRDYIAGASRMAFFDRTNTDLLTSTNCKFTWAPNADVHLEEGDGYTLFDETSVDTITSTSSVEIDGGVEEPTGDSYYFWTFDRDYLATSGPTTFNNFSCSETVNNSLVTTEIEGVNIQARKFEYIEKFQSYVTTVTLKLPTYSDNNPSIPIFITVNTTDRNQLTTNNANIIKNIDGAASKQESEGQYFGVTSTTYKVGDYSCANAFYIVSGMIPTENNTITLTLGYNPETKYLDVLEYMTTQNHEFSLLGQGVQSSVEYPYYPLPNNSNTVLANRVSAVALSTVTNHISDISFKDDTQYTIKPMSVKTSEMFTALKTTVDSEHPSTDTYQFYNESKKQYLVLTSSGLVSYSNTAGTQFKLEYNKDVTGPLIKSSDGYYLVFENGSMKGVKTLTNYTTALTVFTGDSYTVITDYEVAKQTYSYYRSGYTSESVYNLNDETGAFNCATTPIPLYASPKAENDDTDTIGVMIAELKKADETSEFYTAKITMRIWVEGTDNEAQIPLAEGRFNFDLHFTNRPSEETTE